MQKSSLLSQIALAQMEVIPGQPEINLHNALRFLDLAREQGKALVAFPELCLSGYLIGDLWEEQSFVRDCLDAGNELVQASRGMSVVFGNVGLEPGHVGEDGRPRRYNAAWLGQNGELVPNVYTGFPFIPKALLPNYREFEETRHFFDLRRLALERGCSIYDLCGPQILRIGDASLRLGILLCEDGWGEDYGVHLVKHMADSAADVVLNLSASPYTRGKENKRNRVFMNQALEHKIPIGYVNCIGAQNNGKTFFGFDGGTVFYNTEGEITSQAQPWVESLLAYSNIPSPQDFSAVELDESLFSAISPWTASSEFVPQDFETLRNVVARYLQNAGIQRVVIGVSGGIDSAVSAAFFTHLCGSENVLLVSMPSRFNSVTTRNLGRDLALNLQCWFVEIPIEDSVELTRRQIDGLRVQRLGAERELHLSAFHLENVQARDRSARILSALASAFGGVFPCNANKAETTVGYSTLFGDHGGFLAPLADLWKGEVYAFGHYLNNAVFAHSVIPEGIFTLKPSAELSELQNPENGGGDPILYGYHDRLFHAWQQTWNRSSPEEILEWYMAGELEGRLKLTRPISDWFMDARSFVEDLERWWKLFKGMGVVKRVQAPPIVALSRRSFGFDYRESILMPFFSKRYLKRKAELFSQFC